MNDDTKTHLIAVCNVFNDHKKAVSQALFQSHLISNFLSSLPLWERHTNKKKKQTIPRSWDGEKKPNPPVWLCISNFNGKKYMLNLVRRWIKRYTRDWIRCSRRMRIKKNKKTKHTHTKARSVDSMRKYKRCTLRPGCCRIS